MMAARRTFFTVECPDCGQVGDVASVSAAKDDAATIGRMMVEGEFRERAQVHADRRPGCTRTQVIRWDATRSAR